MGNSRLQVRVKEEMSNPKMTKFTRLVISNKQYNKIIIFLTNGMINV